MVLFPICISIVLFLKCCYHLILPLFKSSASDKFNFAQFLILKKKLKLKCPGMVLKFETTLSLSTILYVYHRGSKHEYVKYMYILIVAKNMYFDIKKILIKKDHNSDCLCVWTSILLQQQKQQIDTKRSFLSLCLCINIIQTMILWYWSFFATQT